jgi:molybdate transport system substrate-binding protein
VRLLAAAALLAVAGCGSGTGATTPPAPSGHLTVFAAASLQQSFTAIGRAFEAAHAGSTVTFSFGPSSGLATQIVQGAPADVFAAASPATMQQVVDAKAAADPRTFAANVLEIAVPPGNPATIRSLADLARPAVKVALCQPQVPCGTLAREVLGNAKITVTPATLETDVKAVLTKVQLGEVDAGLVYVTDVAAAGRKVQGITIPPAVDAATRYPIAVLTAAANPSLAADFVGYVLSPAGQAELRKAGFAAP